MVIKGKKVLLSVALDKTKLIDLFKGINYPSLIVVNYHRIYNEKYSYDFDKGVFGPTAWQFEAQMKWLKENFDILSEDDLINIAKKKLPIRNRNFCITFDDAYIDNYEVAFPVLKGLKIPAIFFIPTSIVSNRKVGWWDLIAFFINNCSKKSIELDERTIKIAQKEEKERAIQDLLKTIQQLNGEKYNDFLLYLSKVCDVPFPSIEKQNKELMTWAQIKEVKSCGIAIGSHTHTHKILSKLEKNEQKLELEESKKILEEKIGNRIRSLAYPVGMYSSFTEQTKKLAEATGYQLAFSFNTGINRKALHDPFNIRRIGFDSPLNYSLFKATLSMPYLFL